MAFWKFLSLLVLAQTGSFWAKTTTFGGKHAWKVVFTVQLQNNQYSDVPRNWDTRLTPPPSPVIFWPVFLVYCTVECELKNIWWCLRTPVIRQLCFLMEFCISFRDLFAPIGNPLILYAVLLHPLGTVHGFVIGGPTEKANVCGRGSILSRTTVGTLFTNSGKRNHRKWVPAY